MESRDLVKTRAVVSFTPITILQASAQAVDFKSVVILARDRSIGDEARQGFSLEVKSKSI